MDAERLDELADLGMSLARDLHASALASEDPKVKADLAHAFDRIARSVRMSLALKAKLERDAGRDHHQAHKATVERRKAQVRHTLERLLWTETESEDLELDDALDHAALEDDFASAPIEEIITRIKIDLGLQDPPPGRSPIEGEVALGEAERRRGLQPTPQPTEPPTHSVPWQGSG